MGITDKKKREYLIGIISNHLKVNIALMEYYHAVAPDRKSKLVCSRSIKDTEYALTHLHTIKHTDILEYLYSSFIGNNAVMYSVSSKLVNSKKLAYFDSEKGHQEFLDTMEEQRKEREEKEKAKRENALAIEKAKKEGKKVEMVYNPKTKNVEPLIVEENPKA